MPRMRWRPGLCPGSSWRSRRSLRPSSRLGRGIPPPQELHALGVSILAASVLGARRFGASFLAYYTHLYFLAIHHWEQGRQWAKAGPAKNIVIVLSLLCAITFKTTSSTQAGYYINQQCLHITSISTKQYFTVALDIFLTPPAREHEKKTFSRRRALLSVKLILFYVIFFCSYGFKIYSSFATPREERGIVVMKSQSLFSFE